MLLPLIEKLEELALGLRSEAEDAHDHYMSSKPPAITRQPALRRQPFHYLTNAMIESHKHTSRLETMAEVYNKIADQLTLIIEDEHKELDNMLNDMEKRNNRLT